MVKLGVKLRFFSSFFVIVCVNIWLFVCFLSSIHIKTSYNSKNTVTRIFFCFINSDNWFDACSIIVTCKKKERLSFSVPGGLAWVCVFVCMRNVEGSGEERWSDRIHRTHLTLIFISCRF